MKPSTTTRGHNMTDPLKRDAMEEGQTGETACGCQTGAHEGTRGPIEDHTEEFRREVLPLLHQAHEICCRLGVPMETVAEVADHKLAVVGTAMRDEMCHTMKCIYTLLTDNPVRILRDLLPVVENASTEVAMLNGTTPPGEGEKFTN